MAFKRRESVFSGGGITKYADTNFKVCPFCGSEQPHWLSDAYVAKFSMFKSGCLNGYKFQCEKCNGIFEIQANSDMCFQTENFASIKLVDAGAGTNNKDKLNKQISLLELKKLCSK